MRAHNFSIVLGGVTPDNGEEIADSLYGGGCDDAVMSTRDGVTRLELDREADNLLDAVLSAVRDVESAVAELGVTIARVEPDDMVTVNDIANAIGVTRQSVHLLVKGERGPGSFPAPVLSTSRRRFWRWPEVLDWLLEKYDPTNTAVQHLCGEFRERQGILAAINGALELRRNAGKRAAEIISRLCV
jgi:predicted transcriptional regulator